MRLLLPVTLCIAAAATAQTVWNVTSPDIQQVVNQASPGDVIVLTAAGRFPDYFGFTLAKGLTIRGNGARIGAAPGSSNSHYSILVSIPPGQVAHIENIDTSYAYAPWGTVGCSVAVIRGAARFENCNLRAVRALEIRDSRVVVTGGSVTAHTCPTSAFAISALDSHVELRNCTVSGSDSSCSWPMCSTLVPPTTGLVAVGTVVHAEGVTIRGGSQTTNVPTPGMPALELLPSLNSDSIAYLTDCRLTGGDGSVGGTALVSGGNGLAELRNTLMNGGQPGGGSSIGLVVTNSSLTRLDIVPPWQRGVSSTLTVSGVPSGLYFVFLAPSDDLVTVPLLVVEPVRAVNSIGFFLGALDSQGLASHGILVPNDPALLHANAWFQAVSGTNWPLRSSTIAGGVVR